MMIRDYTIIEEIGQGAFSTVFKAQHNETKEYYAIKRLKGQAMDNAKAVQNQIDLLKKISHRNVIGYITDFKHKDKWYIVFQLCGKGDLQKFARKKGKLPQNFCRNIAYSLVDVLHILHMEKIVHRDLKLANILINDAYDIKLADFGFSKTNEGLMESYCGTPYAMPPQILNGESYDDKCDVWSLGIMIYQLIFGRLPFLPSKQFGAGVIGLRNCVLKSEPACDTVDVSEECKNFIRLCMKKNNNERPRMNELKKHPWINEGVNSAIRRNFFANEEEDKEQITKRIHEIFYGAIAEHVQKLIDQKKLTEKTIKNNLKLFSTYFPSQAKLSSAIFMMIEKKITQLQKIELRIDIEGRLFSIPLKKITMFTEHVKHLKQLISVEGQAKFQKDIITFVARESNKFFIEKDNQLNKILLLQYLAELPIKKAQNSKIEIRWSFNDPQQAKRKLFDKEINLIRDEEVERFANESIKEENIHSNWIIDHEFHEVRREGDDFEVGDFISKIIQIRIKDLK